MSSGIYKIVNKSTGDFYIGSAININNRFHKHKSALANNKHCNYMLQTIYNENGLDMFLFESIEIINDKTKLVEREQHYIDTLNPKYNLCKTAGSWLGYKHRKESRLKMSKNNPRIWKGKNLPEKTKKKISLAQLGPKNHMYGKKVTEERRQQMSELQSGEKNSMFGKKHSKESKLKMSLKHRGRKLSDEHKAKISKSLKEYNQNKT